MGAFDDIAPIILPDPNDPEAAQAFRDKWKWDAHEQVILRGSYTAADMEAVTNASVLSNPGSKAGRMTFLGGTGRIKLMERMILNWTFARNGQTVPVSSNTIRQLPANYQTPILEKCDELAQLALDTEESQQDFLTSANGHTEDNFGQANLSLMR